MSSDPYRLAGIPGDRPTGPDAYLDKSKDALFTEWKELADQRAQIMSVMKKLPQTGSQVSAWAFASGQLSFIDSQMNGILIARAFQRLREEKL